MAILNIVITRCIIIKKILNNIFPEKAVSVFLCHLQEPGMIPYLKEYM